MSWFCGIWLLAVVGHGCMARMASRGLLGVVVLAGCAPVAPAAPGPAAEDTALGHGRVVSMRGVTLPAGNGAEFVVRLDDGRTVSIVQGLEAGLGPGERVVLRHGERVLLAREGG